MSEFNQYVSKSGTEIQAVFNGTKFGDLHMIKYAVQRDVSNIHVMGAVDAVGTGKGKRQTTGACVFAVFEKDRLLEAVRNAGQQVFLNTHEIINYSETDSSYKDALKNPLAGNTDAGRAAAGGGTLRASNDFDPSTTDSIFSSFGAARTPSMIDQIPPFDIVLVGISEASGHASRMIIHGVQFNSDQGGTSVDDLLLERQVTFLAKRISPWMALDKLAIGSSTTITG